MEPARTSFFVSTPTTAYSSGGDVYISSTSSPLGIYNCHPNWTWTDYYNHVWIVNHEVSPKEDEVKIPDFPPCDVYLDNSRNNLVIVLALAGFPRDSVKVLGSKGKIQFFSDISQYSVFNKKGNSAPKYLREGIKKKEFDYVVDIDPCYDPLKARLEWDNGLLRVTIPRADCSPVVEIKEEQAKS